MTYSFIPFCLQCSASGRCVRNVGEKGVRVRHNVDKGEGGFQCI